MPDHDESAYKINNSLRLIAEAYTADACDVTVTYIAPSGVYHSFQLLNVRTNQVLAIRREALDTVIKNGGVFISVVSGPVSR